MSAIRSRLSAGEGGFTLIELLVAMTLGMLVLGAAFTMMDSGARSSTRTLDRVDVTQRGRAVMMAVQGTLRSQVCMDEDDPPIVSGDDNSVTFYTDTDGDPYFRPEKHTLYYDSTWKGGRGAIRETIYTADQTSTTGPPWTYSTAGANSILAEDVTLQPGKTFLAYYPYNDSNTAGDESATKLTTPLSTTITGATLPGNSVAKVIRIDVSFKVIPRRTDDQNGVTGTQTDALRDSYFDTSVFVRNTDYTDTDSKKRVWGPRCS